MLEDYEHKMRIVRDGALREETKDISNLDRPTGLPSTQKSLVFIGATRGKIRTARARIKDVLFGSGKMPFDAVPTQELLADIVVQLEKILTWQLDKMRWNNTVSLGVDDLSTYGTGFICGPFARADTYEELDLEHGIHSREIPYRAPYFERASPMDVYPDPEAEEVHEGIGVYWASRKQPEFIRGLMGKPGYDNNALRAAMNERITSRTNEGTDRTKDARQNLYRYSKDGRIWFLRYFGLVSVADLAQWMGKDTKGIDPMDRIEAVVQLAGGHVVKADINPYPLGRRPIYRCAYEDEPGEVWGTGIARNNRDTQKVINSSFRLYLEGKAFALLKMCSIDRSKFTAREDFKFFPGKRFDMKPDLTQEERNSAIIWHDMVDVTQGWEKAIQLAEHFSDDDTGVTKYSQGTDSENLNKTATGISMIMGASQLPLKEVLANIDESWISPMVNDLLQWDLEFLEPKTVEYMLGKKAAEAWSEIKEYGKTAFVSLEPIGSSTFVQREVLLQKLTGFMTAALGNPITAQHIDTRELISQIWDAAEIGKESPILSEEEELSRGLGQTLPGVPGAPAPGGILPGAPAPGVPPQPILPGPPQPIPPPQPGQADMALIDNLMREQTTSPALGMGAIAPAPSETTDSQRMQKLEALMQILIAQTQMANEIAMSPKVPIRNSETGLIERIEVQRG
ncbi:MAG: hypothetical protein L0Y56_04930 [Nitrospira sp.]|nr:hypothetical protein [Nitrospira sp.]